MNNTNSGSMAEWNERRGLWAPRKLVTHQNGKLCIMNYTPPMLTYGPRDRVQAVSTVCAVISMAVRTDSVTIVVELPRNEYKRVEVRARKERLSVSQVIPELVISELRRRERARRLMSEASASYRGRLAKDGRLDQRTEEIFAALRAIREDVANELFPD